MFSNRHAAGAVALAAVVVTTHAVAADDEIIEAPVCSSAAIEDAYRAAAPSIATVHAPDTHGIPVAGIGFVFHSSRHVATALSLVETGRGIEVLVAEEPRTAVVVAFSRARNIALLRLDRAGEARPLLAAQRKLRVGEPLLAIGHSSVFDEPDVVITPGIVTGIGDAHLRSSALDGPQLNWGGPLLDCEGDVVGIAIADDDTVVPAHALAALVPTIDDSGEAYDSGWSLLHPLVHFHGQIDGSAGPTGAPDGWLGVGVGTALIGDDRWYFPIEARAMFLAGPRSPNPLVERQGSRLQLAAGAGYRFMLSGGDLPLYLVPTIGGVLSHETIVTRGASLSLAPDCAPGDPCPLGIASHESVTSQLRVMPTAGLALQIGFATFGYQLQLDPIAPAHSIHQLTVGFQF